GPNAIGAPSQTHAVSTYNGPSRILPSRIPVPRLFTAETFTLPTSSMGKSPSRYPEFESDDEHERRMEVLALRLTCSTPAFNQSSKFLRASPAPTPMPAMHRGQGTHTFQYQGTLKDDASTTPHLLSRKPSPLLLHPSEDDANSVSTHTSSSSSGSSSSGLSLKPSLFRIRAPTSSDDSTSVSTKPSRTNTSGSRRLSMKPSSLFRLRACRSKTNLHSSDESYSDAQLSNANPNDTSLPPSLPRPRNLFSPCTSPIDEYYHSLENDPTPRAEVPPMLPKSRFKIPRKPVPEYFAMSEEGDANALLTPDDSDSAWAYSVSSASDEAEDGGNTEEVEYTSNAYSALQIVGPNVFIAYDHNDAASSVLAAAFTHVIRLVPAPPVDILSTGTDTNADTGVDATVEFDPTTGVHTLRLAIPPPVRAITEVEAIGEAHAGIRFEEPCHELSCEPVPESLHTYAPSEAAESVMVPTMTMVSEAGVGEPRKTELHHISHSDLVATQAFLATAGRAVSLPELARFLSSSDFDDFGSRAGEDACDEGAPVSSFGDHFDAPPPPLGLTRAHIDAVLAFLRPHPFAPEARRRVLLLTPRTRVDEELAHADISGKHINSDLSREGLALLATYLAHTEECPVRFALRRFEASVGTVGRAWRGVLGEEGALAGFLERLIV
ncbi:hypothetical protein B0H19DRAFT_1121151, partial [Mycena capillaripes]